VIDYEIRRLHLQGLSGIYPATLEREITLQRARYEVAKMLSGDNISRNPQEEISLLMSDRED